MKKGKILITLLILALVVGISSVSAGGYLALLNIKLPSFRGTFTSNPQNKEIENLQYIKTEYTQRQSEASTLDSRGKQSGWMILNTGSTSTWNEDIRNGNNKIDAYNLKIRAVKSNLFGTSYTGIWMLNAELVGKL